MSRPLPGYGRSQAPTLHVYYHPSSASPPDPHLLAQRQQEEDQRRHALLLAKLRRDNEDNTRPPVSRGHSRRPSSSSSSMTSKSGSVQEYRDLNRAYYEYGKGFRFSYRMRTLNMIGRTRSWLTKQMINYTCIVDPMGESSMPHLPTSHTE